MQSQGHWSPRTRPPHPPTAGCRQLWGWTPCLKPDAWGAGGYVSGGRCVTLKAQQCRTRGFPVGREQEAVPAADPRGCPLGRGADPPRLPLDPGWAQGAGSWTRMQTRVCKHLLGAGGRERTDSFRPPRGLRPGSSELLVCLHKMTRSTEGPQTLSAGNQAGGGVVRHWGLSACPLACPR